MPDLDRLLQSDLSHAAAQAVQPPDFSAIEQIAARRHRARTTITAPQPATHPTPRPTGDALARHWTPLRPDTPRRMTASQSKIDEADTSYGGIDLRGVHPGVPSQSLRAGVYRSLTARIAATARGKPM